MWHLVSVTMWIWFRVLSTAGYSWSCCWKHHKYLGFTFSFMGFVWVLWLNYHLSGSDLGPWGGHASRSQGLSVRPELCGRHWGAHCPTAEGNPRQEFCQLQRLLWEVGADGESDPAVSGPTEPTRWVTVCRCRNRILRECRLLHLQDTTETAALQDVSLHEQDSKPGEVHCGPTANVFYLQ